MFGNLSSEQFINVYPPSTEKPSQVNPDKTPSTVSPCGFTLFACLAAGSLPVSRCAKYGIFVTASAHCKKDCLHGRSSQLIPICSWRTFRCQYGKVIDVIGLCFSETNRVLDMASAHVVGNGWYSDRQSELSSLDMFFELENSSPLDMFDMYSIKNSKPSLFTNRKGKKKLDHL